MAWYCWLILSGIFLIFEIMTVGFLLFWLSIGSLCAMIVSFFTSNLFVQTAVFVVSSIIFIFATKPLIKKFTHNNNEIKTNVYSTIGKFGIVTKEINSNKCTGQIKIGGEYWSAISQNLLTIPEGTEVEVLKIDGVKAIVTPVKTISK